jgi:hypothetical protein
MFQVLILKTVNAQCILPNGAAAQPFTLLAGTAITCTGAFQASGLVGAGAGITGFQVPCTSNDTKIHLNDALFTIGQAALALEIADVSNRNCTTTMGNLVWWRSVVTGRYPDVSFGNQVLAPGVFCIGTIVLTGWFPVRHPECVHLL